MSPKTSQKTSMLLFQGVKNGISLGYGFCLSYLPYDERFFPVREKIYENQ
jgi:hypothetical protein